MRSGAGQAVSPAGRNGFDHFTVLRLGALELSADRDRVTLEEPTHHMAGGTKLATLRHELSQAGGVAVQALPDDDLPHDEPEPDTES